MLCSCLMKLLFMVHSSGSFWLKPDAIVLLMQCSAVYVESLFFVWCVLAKARQKRVSRWELLIRRVVLIQFTFFGRMLIRLRKSCIVRIRIINSAFSFVGVHGADFIGCMHAVTFTDSSFIIEHEVSSHNCVFNGCTNQCDLQQPCGKGTCFNHYISYTCDCFNSDHHGLNCQIKGK